jgi:hypothetical protein
MCAAVPWWPMLFVAAGENDHDGNEVVQSSLRHLASTRDIDEPIAHHLGVSAGIVKRGPLLNGPLDDRFGSSAPGDPFPPRSD